MPYMCRLQPTVDYIGVTRTVGVVSVCHRFDYSQFCRRFDVTVFTCRRFDHRPLIAFCLCWQEPLNRLSTVKDYNYHRLC